MHRLLGSRPICVLELWDTVQFRFLCLSSKIPLQLSSLSQLSTLHDILNYGTFGNFLEILIRYVTFRSKLILLGRECFFGLRVKCRVLDQAVDEGPQLLLDLGELYVQTLMFFVDCF